MLTKKRRSVEPFLILEMQGRFSKSDIQPLIDILRNELNAKNVFIALDFSKITQVSSIALGAIIKYWKQFKTMGGQIVILKPTSIIKELLKQTNIDKVVPVIEDETELVQYGKKQSKDSEGKEN